MILPIGGILASFLSGIVASTIGWQYMCVVVGGLGLVNFICCLIFLPYNLPKRKQIKINFFSFILLAGGLIITILGLYMISSSKNYLMIALLLIIGIAMVVFFFIYDLKLARVKMFSRGIWNK